MPTAATPNRIDRMTASFHPRARPQTLMPSAEAQKRQIVSVDGTHGRPVAGTGTSHNLRAL